ncbi:hypothetical protein [Campylobacter sp. RKI_CA19_01127]|uniref:hypothetical protein n=1 Tax=Campylobacter sp. RKI_CA19_01127 TaxID=2911628 RepID=UPI0021E87B86|nr:hypothetical protein [Campylobacter sp. RKI_CA19_01127]MCV3349847.1 hypothetical protein [Campylobacter sp. RKI_CA19_01127]
MQNNNINKNLKSIIYKKPVKVILRFIESIGVGLFVNSLYGLQMGDSCTIIDLS